MDIQQKNKSRLQFLHEVYTRSEGNRNSSLIMWNIGQTLGFDRKVIENITDYLVGEFLLEYAGLGGFIRITHEGIKAVENDLSSKTNVSDVFFSDNPPISNVPSISDVFKLTNNSSEQEKPKSIDYFICHSQIDYAIAKDLKEIIEANGHVAYVAHREIPDDKENWHAHIQDQILASKSMVVIATKNLHTHSTYCHYEIGFADRRNIPIYVFAFESAKVFDKHIEQRQLIMVNKDNLQSELRGFLSRRFGDNFKLSPEKFTELQTAVTKYYGTDELLNLSEDFKELTKRSQTLERLVAARLSDSSIYIDYEYFKRVGDRLEKNLKAMGQWDTYTDIVEFLKMIDTPQANKSLFITLHEKLRNMNKILNLKLGAV